jgi:type I restriction enzyme M protein
MTRYRLRDLLVPRATAVRPPSTPDDEFTTLTVHQTGRISRRPAGIGRNPPAWFGAYFRNEDWYRAEQGDLIYSRIDLWKGCVGVVPAEFDGAIVSKEFPLYQVREDLIRPHYLRLLLRTVYFQRAIRAITTGSLQSAADERG